MACEDYSYPDYHEIFNDGGADMFLDLFFCPYGDTVGTVVFITIVMLGVVNVPIYIRQGSALGPFIFSILTAGIWLSQVSSLFIQVVGSLVILVITLAPILPLMKLRRR